MMRLTPKQAALLERLPYPPGDGLAISSGRRQRTADALVRKGLARLIGEDWQTGIRTYVRVKPLGPLAYPRGPWLLLGEPGAV
jgi:hypothetical protein